MKSGKRRREEGKEKEREGDLHICCAADKVSYIEYERSLDMGAKSGGGFGCDFCFGLVRFR